MDVIKLLDEGYGWTLSRVSVVKPPDLTAPTPCAQWDLGRLLAHTIGALRLLTDAATGDPTPWESRRSAEGPSVDEVGPDPMAAFAEVAARSRDIWAEPGALERTCEIPLGRTPAPMAAQITMLEVVVHGWDVAQATGEREQIPAHLAEAILAFARQILHGDRRGYFDPDVGIGETPSDRLVAYLGRTP